MPLGMDCNDSAGTPLELAPVKMVVMFTIRMEDCDASSCYLVSYAGLWHS